MKRFVFVGCTIAGLFCSSVFAVDAKPGWGTTNDYQQALDYAKKTGKPVAILYEFHDSTCPLHNGSADYFMSEPAVQNMAKIVAYVEDKPAYLPAMAAKVKDGMMIAPELFILDPNGKLTAFLKHGEEQKLPQVASMVNDLASWEKTSVKQIAAADKLADQGKFAAALKVIRTIDRQDRVASAALKPILPLKDPSDASTPGKTSSPTDAGQKAAADAPSASKAKKSASPHTSLTESKAKTEELPDGSYFSTLVADKRTAYEAKAAERLQQAKDALADNHCAAARRAIVVMVSDKADFDEVKEAADLMKQIDQAEADSKKAPKADAGAPIK